MGLRKLAKLAIEPKIPGYKAILSTKLLFDSGAYLNSMIPGSNEINSTKQENQLS